MAICQGKKVLYYLSMLRRSGCIYNIMRRQINTLGTCLNTGLGSYTTDYNMHSAYDFMCNITLYDVMLAYKNEKHSTKNHLNRENTT